MKAEARNRWEMIDESDPLDWQLDKLMAECDFALKNLDKVPLEQLQACEGQLDADYTTVTGDLSLRQKIEREISGLKKSSQSWKEYLKEKYSQVDRARRQLGGYNSQIKRSKKKLAELDEILGTTGDIWARRAELIQVETAIKDTDKKMKTSKARLYMFVVS